MTIYEKLQKCRVELQKMNIKKSGENKFSGYSYFELSDFLPPINELFDKYKLCSVVSFGKEVAEMTIYDSEKECQPIVFTSPMAEANLKGCHPIQNLGAVETYSRRYLYMSALEIVEADVLDRTHNKTETTSKPSKEHLKALMDSAKAKNVDIKELLKKHTGKESSSEMDMVDYSILSIELEKIKGEQK